MKNGRGLLILAVAGTSIALAIGWFVVAPAVRSGPLREVETSNIGYSSVAAALADLRSRPAIEFTTHNGWTIATDEAAYTIWSFAPRGYPAYPAVVQRRVIPQLTGSRIQMTVKCEASKEACDDLVRTFARLNGLPLPQ